MDLYESRLRRRALLGAAGLGVRALVLGSCGNTATRLPAPLPTSTGVPNTGTSTGARTPQTVTQTGTVHEFSLTAAPTEVEIGGQRVSAWAYNGQVPGPEIRVTEGDTLRIALANGLPEDTSIHWHGLAIPNAMDGVPGVTQPPITSGKGFLYEFIAPHAGTYMYHPHTGLQLDRGLYGPLIVEPRNQIQRVDREYTLMFDDWLDATPEDTLRQLKATGDRMGGMGGTTSGRSGMGGARASTASGSAESPPDVVYPRYLVNGTSADAPQELTVNEGETVRLRFINPSSATIYRVALAGHTFTVTHADGQPVEPREVDTVRIGMGERYDVLVHAIHPGVWQLAARAEGTTMLARTVLRYQGDASPAPAVSELPRELAG